MEPFKTLSATACPLLLANVDTDQLIPARFMSRPRAAGYGPFLLHDLRTTTTAALEDARYSGAKILVVQKNFGVGSSREAAVYALWDFGIRCVIAPSFGDIFAANAAKNGLLAATVVEAEGAALLSALATADVPSLTVDLDALTIQGCGLKLSFAIDPVRRTQLLNGLDDIDMTLQHTARIAAFRKARTETHPWFLPALPKAP